ncbi:hypothetical protein [Hymenobacter sp.]|uniref:hypothetical protein n=1 Tax=Hymenobacter sp. TaxID=1898978 RepID=UPI00286C181A|nr:hypothetical protein [Hymenobacter sp.]
MRPFQLLLLLCCALLLGACATPHYGPRGFWKPNRYDRNGLARGRWRTHYDSAGQQPFTAGQYRHGRPVRTFRYYAPTGALDRSERYGRAGFCEVTYWYPNGQVARRGNAQWVTGAKGARFYWFGPWTSYAEDGQTTAIQTYTDGTISRAETYEKGKLTQVETHDERGKVIRSETYLDGQLLKVETFDKGLRTGTTNTL